MTLHRTIPLAGRHAAHAFEYANAAARAGAVGLVAADVGKLARQLDDDSLWLLTNHVGPAWVQEGYGSAAMIRADGTVPFSGDQSMGGFALTNLADAANPQDAFTRAQHDAFADAHVTSGFPNRLADSTVTFNEGTRELAIAPTGATFEVWSAGVQHLKGASAITITDVTGWHFVYFDAAGTLTEAVNPSAATIATAVKTLGLVAIIDWDGVNHRRIWRGDERHGTLMDGADHYHWHESVGTTYRSGCTPDTFAADQSGALAAHAQFGVGAGSIADEDVEHTLAARLSTALWHVLYKSGATGAWVRVHPKAAFPVATAGSGRLAWNQLTGGAWQLTEVTDGRFVLAHVFATNDPDDPYMAVVGQAEYGNLNAARAAAPEELLTLNTAGLPAQELLWVATVIYQTDNTYGNAVKGRVRTLDGVATFIDWRLGKITGSAASVADHGALAGLADDDHPQYRTRVATITPVVATPRAIITTDSDNILVWLGVGTGTFTLPDSAASGAGFRVRVQNKGVSPPAATVVVQRAGADVIQFAGSLASTSVTSTDRDASLEFYSNGAGVWQAALGERTWTDGAITHHFNANIQGGTTGNFASIDANDDLQDAGVSAASFEVPLTFGDSLNRAVNTVTLDNDSAAPGNSYYYGTNSAGTKGWHLLPVSEGGGSDMTIYSNIAGDFSVTFEDGDELNIFGLPAAISAVQIRKITRKPTGAAVSVIKNRGTDLVCTWTPDGSIPLAGVITTTSLGTLLASDEFIVEIDGPPKGFNAATDSAKTMVTNALHYVNDGVIADLTADTVEIVKPLLADGYNAFSLSAVLGAAGDGVTVLGSNDPAGSADYHDITALALGVPQVTVSGAYQTAEPLMFQYVKIAINGTTSARVYLTRFRR